ncbi:MAG: hypothetical protein NT084_11815 [Bacteroidetes bacterium]|nr:hypothetical protein [Bacteroidota bacterium]
MKRILFFLLVLGSSSFGCKKNTDPIIVPANGVSANLFVNHHGVPIAHARVFVKYGTLVFPGTDTTLYDQRYVTDANGRLTIAGLPNGQNAYTFYSKGVDPGWDTTHVTPVWGYQFLITDTHTGETLAYNVSVPVSE